MVAVALAPPNVDRVGAAPQSVSVRLLSEAPRVSAIASTTLFAEPQQLAVATPQSLLTDLAPQPSTATTPNPLTAYLPSSAMERRPMPVSEPNIASVRTDASSGLPVRLRLYIDRLGNVVSVVPLLASDADAAFVAALERMFRTTAFIPGQRGGVDVASYMDIELVAR